MSAPSRTTVRLLLGCTGWPSGILEIASWAQHQRLAQPVVFQIQPGYACDLPAEDRVYLRGGPIDGELADSLARAGRPVTLHTRMRPVGPGEWEIEDPVKHITYAIRDSGQRLEITVPFNYRRPEFLAAIRRYASRQRDPSQYVVGDGALSAAAQAALMACGGEFVVQLIQQDPHLVGFRVEAGGLDQIRQFLRAVRLFSTAHVVLGGPTATSHPIEVLEQSGADYVFAGEAEESFGQFLRLALDPRLARRSCDFLPEIPGLAYRWAGRTLHNTLPHDGYERSALDSELEARRRRVLRHAVRPVAPTEVLAANWLDWSLLKNFRSETDSLFFTGGRGCPGNCTFCSKLHGQEVRVKSAAQLLAEIEAADAKVADGTLHVTRWDLFSRVEAPGFAASVAWAAIYDEDFFLDRRRALEFFALWNRSPLKDRYRLSVQTNPCTLLGSDGAPHAELFAWIDRLKPMVQLGAESFHPEVLARWRKRHTVEQLVTVADALERTRQDYTLFILLSDFDTTPSEFLESLRRLILAALPRRRMRIASSPFTIPLYDSDTRQWLQTTGRLPPGRIRDFTDYERPQPEWMDPLVAELADLADAELRWALQPAVRDAALMQAFQAVAARLRGEPCAAQAAQVAEEIREARFQALDCPAFL